MSAGTDQHGEATDVFANGEKKIDRELNADYHRYRVNPGKWFVEYFQSHLNLEEQDAMKLKDFFAGIFSGFTAPLKKATDDLKTAKEAKNIGGFITAIGGVVEVAAKTVEQTSSALKQAGVDVASEQKHDMAKQAVVAIASEGVNKVIDIPGLPEDQESQFFNAIFGGIVDALIKSTVKKLNKTGWTL